MHAILRGNHEIARLLLQNGVSVNKKSYSGLTVLMIAAKRGDDNMVNILLESDANVNEKDNNARTALLFAIDQQHESTALLLIEKGRPLEINLNILDRFGCSALIRALGLGLLGIARALVDNGASLSTIDCSGISAVIIAATSGYTELALELIEKGCFLDVDKYVSSCIISYTL